MKRGDPCPCGRGKPTVSRGMCSICYAHDREKYAPKCACGKPATGARGLCKTCYRREQVRSGVGIAADVKSIAPWGNFVKRKPGSRMSQGA